MLLLLSTALTSGCGTSAGTDGTAGPAGTGSGDGTTAPAGGAGSAALGDVVACQDLAPVGWSAAPTDADLPFQIAARKAPGLGGDPSGPATASSVYKTADEFLAQSNIPDPETRKRVMDQAGYLGGVEAEWTGGNGYTIQALSFADARSAADYVAARLSSICGQGGTQNGVTMLGDEDGITWTDPLGATHGEFILGGSQVSLTSCGGCEPVSLEEMQAWHDAFVDAYATGPAVPIT